MNNHALPISPYEYSLIIIFLNKSTNSFLFIYICEGYSITQSLCPVAFIGRLLQNLAQMTLVLFSYLQESLWCVLIYTHQNNSYLDRIQFHLMHKYL